MLEDVDRDAVYAIASAYRQLALLQDDPGNFDRIRNLLGRHAHEAGTEDAEKVRFWLKTLKSMRKDVREGGPVVGYKRIAHDETTKTLTPQEVIDWLVWGVVSHPDPDARAWWNQWAAGTMARYCFTP